MSAGYVIAQLKITNPENYKEYVEKVTPLVKKFGGEFLVRAGEFQIFDGETKFPRIIVLKFPSYEKALEWYNSEEYKPIKQIRLDNSEGTNIIIKGIWKNNSFTWIIDRSMNKLSVQLLLKIKLKKIIVHLTLI